MLGALVDQLVLVVDFIDDEDVLALTLYWLDHNGIIDPAILREHWEREDDPIEVANKLHQVITEDHSKFFSDDKAWEIISAIAEKGPRVLWQIPK